MSVVVKPSARETFTPRELATAYQDFTESGPQYVNAESGLEASVYRFGTRVLIVYKEAETGVVLIINPMPRDEMFSRSVDSRTPGRADRIGYVEYLRNDRLH